MGSIQSFKYKRKDLTVIFWNCHVWFKAKEIFEILGYKRYKRYRENFSRFLSLVHFVNVISYRPRVKLISENALYILTYHKASPEKTREKAKDLYEFVQEKVMPVFDEYIKSWF